MSLTVADIIALTIAVVVVALTIFMIAEAWLGRNEPTEDAPQPAHPTTDELIQWGVAAKWGPSDDPKAHALATMAATEMLREEFANLRLQHLPKGRTNERKDRRCG